MFLMDRKEGKRENSSKIKGMQQIRLQMNANGEDIYISIYIYIYIKNTYSLVCLWPQEGVWHLWTRQFLEEETHSSFHRCRPEKTTMEKLSESMYFWSESINVQTTHTETSELEGIPAVMAWDVVSFGCSGAAETEKRTTQVTITTLWFP